MIVSEKRAITRANTPEWLEARKGCIGASEAAAACGVDPYRQPLQIYLEKRGELEPEPENDAMRLGSLLEPVCLAEYSHRTGATLDTDMGLYLHQETPYLGATPDAIRMDVPTPYPVEAKTTTHWRAKEFGAEPDGEITPEYFCQVQHQMNVLYADRCDLPVLIDGRTLRIYQVAREEDLIRQMVKLETELWERIQNGDPPEPNWEHASTVRLLQQIYREVEGEAVELSMEDSYAWAEYQAIGSQIRDLEKVKEKAKAQVLNAIGNAPSGILYAGEGKAVSRSIVKASVYTEADVEAIKAKIGQPKRKSYITLRERKVKS